MVKRCMRGHDKQTKKMQDHPSIIGLEDIMMSTREVNLFRTEEPSQLYHQPDNLFFDPWSRTLYNVEYKCGNHLKNKAIHQLRDVNKYLKMMFPQYEIKNLYIHDNFKIEEIK